LSVEPRAVAIVAVQAFNIFTKLDCASVTLKGRWFFWTIDYDAASTYSREIRATT
jgi:hypothetical protein